MEKNKCLFYLLFYWCLLNVTCSSPKQMADKKSAVPILNKTAFLQLPITKSGTYDTTLKLENGHAWPLLVHIPRTDKPKPRPLIIALHWAGPPETYREYASCLVLPALSQSDAIIVAPSSENFHWWESEGINRVSSFVNLARQHWPIDSTKILLTGYSNGGTGVVALAQKLPENTISAIIPMAGSYLDINKLTVPAYFIHGKEDELFDYEMTRLKISEAMRKNKNIKFITASGKSHYQACSYASYLTGGIEWVEAEIW